MVRHSIILALLCTLLLIGACGQKGPLVLPDTTAATSAQTVPAEPAAAADEDEDVDAKDGESPEP